MNAAADEAAPRRRGASLRTRSFIVIAVAVLIPSTLLATLGTWAYFRAWSNAESFYADAAARHSWELADEVSSIGRLRPQPTAVERAELQTAIVQSFAQGHPEGAWYSTVDELAATQTLPSWAIRSLTRRGFAIGGWLGPAPAGAIVAWRSGPSVRYYTQYVSSPAHFSPRPQTRRLVLIGLAGAVLIATLGLLGAFVLSRSVVRPVRRLAEASRRLAEGDVGVQVTPAGPSEIRELAWAFNDMNAKLTKAQEAEQSFLLSVSHELKTPLTSIRGYAEGLSDGALPAAEAAAVVGTESARLERLVGDLLDSARMRKSAFTVRSETVDLAAVAAEVARRHEATAREAGLTLTLKLAPHSLATADHDRVLQVVSNLVENAVRCTPAPGSVTVSTAPGLVSVADTGRGLTSDDLPRAFERFYLYSRYGNERPVGTGLGLAIVKELTEAMDGRVRVSSAVGVGTAFFVELPIAETAPIPTGVEPEPPAGPGPVAPALLPPEPADPVAPVAPLLPSESEAPLAPVAPALLASDPAGDVE